MPDHWWDNRTHYGDREPSWLWTALLVAVVFVTLLAVVLVVAK